MSRMKKLAVPVTLFAAVEQEQHEALRLLAFSQRRSLADVTRDALAEYISRHAEVRHSRTVEKRTTARRAS
jgi:hypothetical protein